MKTLTTMLMALALTGCGTYGEPLWLAHIADQQDPCQTSPMPKFCGAGQGVTAVTRDYATGRYISTTRIR